MELEHLEFSEALIELAEKTGVNLNIKRAPPKAESSKKQIYSANHLAGEYFQYLLLSHSLGKNAREYLKNRGVSEKIIKHSGLVTVQIVGMECFRTSERKDTTRIT